MIALLFIAMAIIDLASFLPRSWTTPAFMVLAPIVMVAEGLQ
jgi:hypothetical protein